MTALSITEILKQRKKDLDQIPSSMNLISPTIHQSIEKLRKEYTVALEELDLAQKYFHLSKV